MQERDTHVEDDSQDIEDNELENTVDDDDTTAADTDDESDEPKKSDTSKEAQKLAWLKKIDSGEKTLEDMPKNLGWLKKEIQEDKNKSEEKPKGEELEDAIRKVLTEREASNEFDFLVEDLQNAEISAEQEAQLKEEYEGLLEDYPNPTEKQKLKALVTARRLVGIKDTAQSVRERRRKGMSLPPLSGQKKRSTVQPDKQTEIDKRFDGGLPPGFKA